MSEAQAIELPSVAAPRSSRTLTLLLVVLLLALTAGVGLLGANAWAMRGRLEGLNKRLTEQNAAAGQRAAAVDAAFAPVALTHVKAAQALLKKGDKPGAKAELKQAQKVAVSVRDLGSGNPPGELIASLTAVERSFGQPPTLTAPAMGGT